MTIYTGCPHCGKAISFELPPTGVKAAPGNLKLACKVGCEKCGKLTDVFITMLPTGEVHEVL